MTTAVCIRAKQQAIHKIPKEKKLRQYTRKMERCLYRKTYLSERICAAYLQEHPSDYESKPLEITSLDIAPGVSAEDRAVINKLALKSSHP